jgi:general secretion pathway protein D
MTKIIVVTLLLVIHLVSSDLKKISIENFTYMMAKQHDITILLPEDYSKTISLYISSKPDPKMYMKVLRDVLYLNGLMLKKKRNYYVIVEKSNEKKKKYTYKIKHMDSEEITVLESIFPDAGFHLFKSENILVYTVFKDMHKQIMSMLEKIDKLDEQVTIKLNIFETTVSKNQKIGIDTGYQGDGKVNNNYFLNLLTSSSAPTNLITASSASSFYSFIKALDSNGTSKVLLNPYFTIQTNKRVTMDVVETIKRAQNTTNFQGATSQNTTNFKDEDVGLKMNVLAKIVNDDIYIDLDLSIEDVLGSGDNQKISRKRIKNIFHVKKNDIIVLSGFRKEVVIKTENRIPYLSSIWLLGNLFTSNEDVKSTSVLSITLQVVKEESAALTSDVSLSNGSGESVALDHL